MNDLIEANRIKLKKIYIFGDKNKVSSSDCNAIKLKIWDKFDHPFSHVFIFSNMFPESHSFVAIPVTSCIKDSYSILYLSS